MSSNGHAATSEVRAQLNHPIIDADGHWLEFGPLVREEMRKIGGDKAVEGFSFFPKLVQKELAMSVAERRANGTGQQAFWALPTKNTRDRATAMLPKLLYERLDELGIDFGVIYPTGGALFAPFLRDDEIRRAACRAFNMYTADQFKGLEDRLTPAAVVPMFTPEEAVEELEFIKSKGFKVAMLSSLIRRQVPAVARKAPEAGRYAIWHDTLGIDSEHDYDPVWAKCLEVGIPPSFHSASSGIGMRASISNFVYNHIGHFAQAGEAVCKSIFMNGVTRRFPELRFAFLEGGVGWACGLYSDLIGHWKIRNPKALDNVNPANLNQEMLVDLFQKYASPAAVEKLGQKATQAHLGLLTKEPEKLDDFAPCGIERAEDIRDLFVPNFYFGCEADDPLNAWAFNTTVNPYGAKINALFGSDIGHFDVPDMAGVLPEAYEGVEDGVMTEDNFRDFVFANPVRFWSAVNPDFFTGTVVESQARALVAEGAA